MARRSGFERIITFDMGGTSTDVALVDREARASSQAEIAGFPIGVPMLDIHTVGAGGGSIARFDAGGALRVGPESAGADPGPICYGRGTQPTVTDANLLLGRLQPAAISGRRFHSRSRTHPPPGRRVAQAKRIEAYAWNNSPPESSGSSTPPWRKPYAWSPSSAATIRGSSRWLPSAARAHSTPANWRRRSAFRACSFPPCPELSLPSESWSATWSRTTLAPCSGASRTNCPSQRLEREFAALRRRAEKDFRAEKWKGTISHERSVDVRYQGQGYELNVPYTRNLIRDFRREHQRRYGYNYPTREVELVTLRLRSTIKSPVIMRWEHRRPRGDGRPRPSWPGKARQRIFQAHPSILRRKSAARNHFPRFSSARQETIRSCGNHGIQRNHGRSSEDDFSKRSLREPDR